MARCTMRQRLVSIGEDFDITDEHGNLAYRVDGKVMRLRDTEHTGALGKVSYQEDNEQRHKPAR